MARVHSLLLCVVLCKMAGYSTWAQVSDLPGGGGGTGVSPDPAPVSRPVALPGDPVPGVGVSPGPAPAPAPAPLPLPVPAVPPVACCAGYYSSADGQCVECPANTYQETRNVVVPACTQCPPGTFSYVGTARAVDCNTCNDGIQYWQPYKSEGCTNCCETPTQVVAFLDPPPKDPEYGVCRSCPKGTFYDGSAAAQGQYPCAGCHTTCPPQPAPLKPKRSTLVRSLRA